MKLEDFQFDCPPDLIAQFPAAQRTASRLLCLDGNSGALADQQFPDLLGLLRADDLLVFNDTKVIPARLLGEKETGGKIEVLVERVLDSTRVLAHVRSSKSPKAGRKLLLEGVLTATMIARQGALFELDFAVDDISAALEAHGRLPLPPYIERDVALADRERYQTVYAENTGAVAAPTAGLHFDDAMLAQIEAMGIETAHVTLHVGAGTFQPVRVDDVATHTMHSEWIDVSAEVCAQVQATRARGGRVIAVGTTSVRALESASRGDKIAAYRGETDIFIYPGYQFKSVDVMVTNFHLSESTLLMLVSAFAGRDAILAAYEHAVAQQYRFFSYGDAMFITQKTSETA